MVKSKIWVRRLTLPPSSQTRVDEAADQQDDQADEEQIMLFKERLARTTDLANMGGQGNIQRPHIHGVEPSFGSKFWATGDGDSSEESEEEEIKTPTLVREALAAGFIVAKICQAEAELDTPLESTPKVCAKLRDGSISKKKLWTFGLTTDGTQENHGAVLFRLHENLLSEHWVMP
jgi:hypothetical protein